MSNKDKQHALWAKISNLMSDIQSMDNSHAMRRRFNPHHPIEQRRAEVKAVRMKQYELWQQAKDLYGEHRDELVDTLESDRYKSCQEILERIFTQDLDDALKEVLDE